MKREKESNRGAKLLIALIVLIVLVILAFKEVEQQVNESFIYHEQRQMQKESENDD